VITVEEKSLFDEERAEVGTCCCRPIVESRENGRCGPTDDRRCDGDEDKGYVFLEKRANHLFL
jgi:hypothetical protein